MKLNLGTILRHWKIKLMFFHIHCVPFIIMGAISLVFAKKIANLILNAASYFDTYLEIKNASGK